VEPGPAQHSPVPTDQLDECLQGKAEADVRWERQARQCDSAFDCDRQRHVSAIRNQVTEMSSDPTGSAESGILRHCFALVKSGFVGASSRRDGRHRNRQARSRPLLRPCRNSLPVSAPSAGESHARALRRPTTASDVGHMTTESYVAREPAISSVSRDQRRPEVACEEPTCT